MEDRLLELLESVLGKSKKTSGDNYAFYSPFVDHYKPKLEINIRINSKGDNPWHCWISDEKGKTIKSLFKKLRVSKSTWDEYNSIFSRVNRYNYDQANDQVNDQVELPKEFKPLYQKPKSINFDYNQAIGYLHRRGIHMDEILKYNIGYCEDGLYGGRVIIPSYNEDGELNYFVARSYREEATMKYKNPPVSRDVIVFDNQINWNEPITLVEGVFDSFSVKRNVIPILGKFIPRTLQTKIKEKGVKEINILLDSDAVEDSTKHANYFIKNGIKVKNIIPEGGDAGDLGFDKINNLLKETEETGWDDLILSKLNNL